jgi:hypothetical protein
VRQRRAICSDFASGQGLHATIFNQQCLQQAFSCAQAAALSIHFVLAARRPLALVSYLTFSLSSTSPPPPFAASRREE